MTILVKNNLYHNGARIGVNIKIHACCDTRQHFFKCFHQTPNQNTVQIIFIVHKSPTLLKTFQFEYAEECGS